MTAILLLAWVLNTGAEQLTVHEDWRTPTGQMVDIGGYRLHLLCMGKGSPTVVLDSGMGGFSLEWSVVQRMLSGQVRVCAYDRAGYGWSDVGPVPRTTKQVVTELHKLLENARIPPPYVLVGHSFGGYNVQYFAKHFPEESAGLVLIDSSHPLQTDRLPDLPALRDKTRNSDMVTFFFGQNTFKYYPEDIRYRLLRILSLKKNSDTYRRESINFSISGQQVQNAGPFPQIPLIVLTRGMRAWPDDPYGDMLEYIWSELQKELARLTPTGRQIFATQSDHLIHLQQPDVVASAIMSIVDETRQRIAQYTDQ